MGNGSSDLHGYQRQYTRPRAEVETPIDSEPSRRRVTFANAPSGVETITVKPQMEAVGEFPPEFLTGRKVKFTRTQMSHIGSNSYGETNSDVVTPGRSQMSGPSDGFLEPILDPYAPSPGRTNTIVTNVVNNGETVGNNPDSQENMMYSPRIGENGLTVGHNVRKRLASVEGL